MRHASRVDPRRSRLRAVAQAGLALSACAGTLCIIAALGMGLLGVKPLVFVSGSMSPTIETGDLAFARAAPVHDLRIGDIVSVPTRNGDRVTHRIQKVDRGGSKASLTLKGDANSVADTRPYVVSSADRVLFNIPKLGYAVHAMSSPLGIFAAGVGFAGLMFLVLRPSPPLAGGRRRAVGSRVAVVVPLAMLLVLPATGSQPVDTFASFTDSVSAPTGGFTSHTMMKAASVDCSDNGSSVTYTWPHRDIRYRYVVNLVNEQGNTFQTYEVTPAASLAAGQPVTQSVSQGDVDSVGTNDSFTVRIWSHVRNSTTWSSAEPATDTGRVEGIQILLSLTRDITC